MREIIAEAALFKGCVHLLLRFSRQEIYVTNFYKLLQVEQDGFSARSR
jgi:hypothetical protein